MIEWPLRAWRACLAWCAVVVGAFLAHAALYPGILYDDPYISYRYARNWADGVGIVFNPDEKVEGYSNFLHVAILAGADRVLRVDQPDMGLVLSFGAPILLLILLTCRAVREGHAPIAAMLLALTTPWAFWAGRGLETPVYASLVTVTLVLAARPPSSGAGWYWAASLWTFATLTALYRIEGPMWCLVVGIAGLLGQFAARRRSEALPTWARAWWTAAAVSFALQLAYHGWRVAYFGRLFPNTYQAKATGPLLERLASGGEYLASGRAADALLPFAALLLAVILGGRARATARLFVCAIVAQLGFVLIVGGDWMIMARFLMPVLPIVALLAEDCWSDVAARRRDSPAASMVLVALILATLSGTAYRNGPIIQAMRDGSLTPPMISLAEWMHDRLPHDHWVAGEEMGIIPWFSGLRFVDLHGLITREVADRPGGLHHKFDADWLIARRPEYIILLTVPQVEFDPATLRATHDASGAILAHQTLWREYGLLRRQARGTTSFERVDMLLLARRDLGIPLIG